MCIAPKLSHFIRNAQRIWHIPFQVAGEHRQWSRQLVSPEQKQTIVWYHESAAGREPDTRGWGWTNLFLLVFGWLFLCTRIIFSVVSLVFSPIHVAFNTNAVTMKNLIRMRTIVRRWVVLGAFHIIIAVIGASEWTICNNFHLDNAESCCANEKCVFCFTANAMRRQSGVRFDRLWMLAVRLLRTHSIHRAAGS